MFRWAYRWADGVRQRARRKQWDPELALGRDGEDAAHRYLQARGMRIVARNFRTRTGIAEVDLIAMEGSTLVFVEVKSRISEEFGAPDRAVDDTKRRKILYGAVDFLQRGPGKPAGEIRFDVVSVVFGEKVKITHFRDAFKAPG